MLSSKYNINPIIILIIKLDMSRQSKGSDSATNLSRQNLFTRSKSPTRVINANLHNLKIQRDTSINSIAKTNSSALLKKKSLKRIKTISPLLGKSPSSSILMRNQKKVEGSSKKSSIILHDKNFPVITSNSSYRSITPTTKLNISTDMLPTEDSVYKPKPKVITFSMMVDKYEMYKGIFEEIIQKDKAFSVILAKIKNIYEDFYEMSVQEHTKKLKDKITSLSELLEKSREDSSTIEKNIKKLSTENYELAKSLERSEDICSRIQERLVRISKFNMNSMPRDEQTWKSLITENEAYANTMKNLEMRLKEFKNNEFKYRQVFSEVKAAGFPIEKYYAKLMIDPKETKEKAKIIENKSLNAPSETSESDYLISYRSQSIVKPGIIPDLPLEKIPPVSMSSGNSYSDY